MKRRKKMMAKKTSRGSRRKNEKRRRVGEKTEKYDEMQNTVGIAKFSIILYNVEYFGSLASSLRRLPVHSNNNVSLHALSPVACRLPIPIVIFMFIYFIIYSVLGMLLYNIMNFFFLFSFVCILRLKTYGWWFDSMWCSMGFKMGMKSIPEISKR